MRQHRAMFKPADLLDLDQTGHAALFDGSRHAWDALKKLKAYLAAQLTPGNHGLVEGHAAIGDAVFIGEGTVIEDGAMIKGPAIIGRNCQIRHGAYIRDNVLIGDGCVIDHDFRTVDVLVVLPIERIADRYLQHYAPKQ